MISNELATLIANAIETEATTKVVKIEAVLPNAVSFSSEGKLYVLNNIDEEDTAKLVSLVSYQIDIQEGVVSVENLGVLTRKAGNLRQRKSSARSVNAASFF